MAESVEVLKNYETAEAIPPYSIAEIVSRNSDHSINVKKPTANSMGPAECALTGPGTIQKSGDAGDTNQAAPGFPAWVRYSGTEPAIGDHVGCVSGQWYVEKDKKGFTVRQVNTVRKLVQVLPDTGAGTRLSPVVLASTGATANTDSWDIDSQPAGKDGVEFVAARLYWSGSAGDDVILFRRTTVYDSAGRLCSVGGETADSIGTGACP